MGNEEKITSFTKLNAWKEGHKLVLRIYEETEKFPDKEKFSLTSQIRRSAVSITSNVAEGFSRNSYREKVQFYYMALGSVTELQNQILVAKDVDYVDEETFKEIANQSIIVHKIINGLIKKSKKRSL